MSSLKEKPIVVGRDPLDVETIEDAARGASPSMVAFNIMKTIIGAGIFATPFALNHCGFWFGMFLIVPMGFLFFFTIMTLVHGSIKADASSMQELVRFCFGRWGEFVLNMFLICLAWGFLAMYTVIIGDEVPGALEAVVGPPQTQFMEWFLKRRAQVIIASAFVFLPVSMCRSLAGLAKFSGVALAAILFIIICIVSVAPSVPDSFKGQNELSIIEPRGIPSAIGVIAFAYICHHNVLLNYKSLRDRSPKKFRLVAGVSVLVTVVLTLICGSAFVIFREKSKDIILQNFPQDNTIMIICRLLFGLDMLFTYPLQLFVLRDTIEKAFFSKYSFSYVRHCVTTTLIVLSTCLLACFSCNLGIIIELVGGVTGVAIALIIPCACWVRVNSLRGEGLSLLQKLPYFAIIFAGIALMILNIYGQTIGEHKDKDCKW